MNDPTQTLAGECIVSTGETHQISRASIRGIIEAAGGSMAGAISTSTTLLVVGGPASVSAQKISTARLLGVEIITEAEFVKRLNGGRHAHAASSPNRSSADSFAPLSAAA